MSHIVKAVLNLAEGGEGSLYESCKMIMKGIRNNYSKGKEEELQRLACLRVCVSLEVLHTHN